MTQLILERTFKPVITAADVYGSARAGAWCFQQYRVGWQGSFLSIDGHTLVCTLEAPDAESVRMAFRAAGAEARRLWSASVHEAPSVEKPNVLVERSFDAPEAFDRVHGVEEAKGWCLAQHRVQWVRSFLSADGRRMLCLYRAPDAESVRRAQQEAGLKFDALWSFERLDPDAMPAA